MSEEFNEEFVPDIEPIEPEPKEEVMPQTSEEWIAWRRRRSEKRQAEAAEKVRKREEANRVAMMRRKSFRDTLVLK